MKCRDSNGREKTTALQSCLFLLLRSCATGANCERAQLVEQGKVDEEKKIELYETFYFGVEREINYVK